MKLHEVIGRSQWLELQQTLIEHGFDATLIHDGKPKLVVFGRAPGLDKDFEYHETFYSYLNGFWWSHLTHNGVVPLDVLGALDLSCRSYLEDLREHRVIEHSLLWLAENHKPLARELVSMLLEGKVQVELTVTTEPRPAIEHAHKCGWELFAHRSSLGASDIVFIKR